MSNNILDRRWSAHWGYAVFDEDMIIWEGKPKLKSWLAFIDKKIDLYRYAFTQKLVLFKTTKWFKTSIYTITFSEIIKITYEVYDDGSGTIYFLTSSKPSFKTHDLEKGTDRFYPTFEYIPNVIEVYDRVVEQWELYLKQEPVFEVLSTSPDPFLKRLVYFKYLVYACTLIFTVYVIDFYLLPSIDIVDQIAIEQHTIQNGRWEHELSRWGNYHTTSGLRFSTEENYYSLYEQHLRITYSPIFKSVQNVVIASGRSINHALANDFNGTPTYFHWLTYLALLISSFSIRSVKKWQDEVVMKVGVGMIFMIGLSIFLWYLYA